MKTILILIIVSYYSIRAESQPWTLEQCVDSAMVYNKNISMVNDEIAIAQQRTMETKANLLPKLNFVGEYKYYTDLPYQIMPASAFGGQDGTFKEVQFGVPHNIITSLQLNVPLFNPELYGHIKSSKIALELSQLQSNKTKEQVKWEVSNIYYNGQVVLNQISLLDKNIDNLQTLLKNTELLYRHNIATISDVNRIKLQLEGIRINKEEAESSYQQILNLLKLSMGINIERDIRINQQVKFEEYSDYQRNQLIDERIATTRKNLTLSEINSLKKSRLPSLNAVGLYGINGFGYSEKPNEFLDFYNVGYVGVQISYSIFNGSIKQKRIKQKRALLHKNETDLELITNRADVEISNAMNKRSMAVKELQWSQSQIELAERNYQDITLQYKEGISNLTDVLLSDNEVGEAHQYYISAIIKYLRSDLELKKLTGNILTVKQ